MNVRPTKLDDIIGLKNVKMVCKTLIKSAKMQGKPMAHCLFSGISGGGKTTVARAIAYEMGVELHTVNAVTIKSSEELYCIVDRLRHCDILFIDEIHGLPKKIIESLYTIVEDFCYYTNKGEQVRTDKFTLLAATTETGSLPTPIKNRFKFVAEFQEYTLEELVKIVKQVCKSYNFQVTHKIAVVIAKTCRLTPRLAVNRTEWIRSYFLANNLTTASEDKIKKIIALQGIDENGLEDRDYRYLEVLVNHGPISLSSLSSKLNIDPNTIKNDIEPWLLKKNLIKIITKGRMIV